MRTLFAILALCAAGACESGGALHQQELFSFSKQRTMECTYLGADRYVVNLALPVVTEDNRGRPIFQKVEHVNRVDCNDKITRMLMRPGVYPVAVGNRKLTVEGDICARSPVFVAYDAPSLPAIYGSLQGRGRPGADPMAFRIGAAIAVIDKRCNGKRPDSFRLIFRNAEGVSPAMMADAYRNTYRAKSFPFEYEDILAGRVDVKNGMRFAADDAAKEAAYWEALDRQAWQAMKAQRQRETYDGPSPVLGILGLLGAVQSCDPSIEIC